MPRTFKTFRKLVISARLLPPEGLREHQLPQGLPAGHGAGGSPAAVRGTPEGGPGAEQ